VVISSRIGLEQQLVASFHALGATSPATARPGKELPVVDAVTFDSLLKRGVIREGAPGTFYLYENSSRRVGLLKQSLFWFILIIVPMAIMQFCS
jgi:hypothetical protein